MNIEGLKGHLESCRRDLDLDNLLWVIGNQSVDLDSVVSTLVYAYSVGGIPIINCTSEEFETKTESKYLLQELEIDYKKLIFTDNLKMIAGKVVLIDHHELSPNLSGLGKVWQIVDHHMTKKELSPENLLRIEKVGSCATLVFDLIEKKTRIEDELILKMLAGPILLDTFNLDPIAKKAMELDRSVIEKIQKRSQFSRNQWFNDLLAAKQDVSSLSPKQLLIKDCKRWADYVISSLPISLEETLERAANEVEDFFKASGAKVYMIMTLFQELQFEREILMVTDDDWQLEERLVQFFQKAGFDLIPFNVKGYNAFKQRNIVFSRKEVTPLLEEFFRGV